MSIIKEVGNHALASEFNFNPTVEWAYTNGIIIATLMSGQRRKQVERARSAYSAEFFYNRDWTELAEMPLCLSMHTLETLIQNKLVKPLPPGFAVSSGTVTYYDPRENSYRNAYHTWLQRTRFDGSTEVLDFFASQFMYTDEKTLIAGEKRMELKRRVRESSAPIIYAELGTEYGIVPFILGNAEDFQRDLKITYIKGGELEEKHE